MNTCLLIVKIFYVIGRHYTNKLSAIFNSKYTVEAMDFIRRILGTRQNRRTQNINATHYNFGQSFNRLNRKDPFSRQPINIKQK